MVKCEFSAARKADNVYFSFHVYNKYGYINILNFRTCAGAQLIITRVK